MTQSLRQPVASPGAARLNAYLRLRKAREVGVILLVILVSAAALAGTAYMQASGRATNWGFGPEWRCSWPGKGGPVCVRRVAPIDKPAAGGG